MSAQLTLTRSSSLVSLTSTLVEEEEARKSKLSPSPSQNGLKDLEKQALATNVPTVGILEKFSGAKKIITSTAQKTANILAKPKSSIVKEAKTDVLELVPTLKMESQLPVQTNSLAIRFAHNHLRSGALIGTGVGAAFGTGTLVGSLAVFNLLFGTEPMGGSAIAIIGVYGGLIGNFAGGLIQKSIEARHHTRNNG